ncbi:MAG TPA: hypothetical protein VGJ30_00675 [Candidatus Angelobacter sp.]
MKKEEIIAAIRKCAKELGRTPSLGELTERVHISTRTIRKLFGNYGMAVRACGMEPPRGAPTPLEDLFEDWAGVVRKTGKLPTIFEYERESAYSSKPLVSRFKGWRQVPQAMVAFAERHGQGDWADVLEIAKATGEGTWLANSTSRLAGGPPGTGKILKDRPTFGPPMTQSGMLCGPENENGVLFLFGMMAWQLGFAVKKVQQAFPDVIALRKIDEQTWQEVKIELEKESRNFLRHGHPPSGCDLIICWVHNWPECPVEVIELSTMWMCLGCGRK